MHSEAFGVRRRSANFKHVGQADRRFNAYFTITANEPNEPNEPNEYESVLMSDEPYKTHVDDIAACA